MRKLATATVVVTLGALAFFPGLGGCSGSSNHPDNSTDDSSDDSATDSQDGSDQQSSGQQTSDADSNSTNSEQTGSGHTHTEGSTGHDTHSGMTHTTPDTSQDSTVPDSGSGSDSASSGTGTDNTDDPYAKARQDCVDRINAFRATENKAPLTRWVDAEACTDDQSKQDSEGGTAHAHFGLCKEFAQNTCPGWGSVDQVIKDCLQAMWDEGPGEPFEKHGHYINMSNEKYTTVACGFYKMPNGDIWHNHNFK